MSAATSVDALSIPGSRAASTRLLAGATIVLSAFLLFQIQPILAKMILPWFGGTAAVWTTCMLFFQCLLFAGYCWAHALARWVAPRRQIWIQSAFLVLSLLMLPAVPDPSWRPGGLENPIVRILGLLLATVGLPYFLLASTSPLTQAWISRSGAGTLPYRFYALSNLASLAGLLAYPVAIEPFLPAPRQALAWSWSYGLYVVCAVWLAFRSTPASTARPEAEYTVAAARPPFQTVSWLFLSACPSILTLAVTNHLTQNVASIPFLWILPLGVYLLTLILCFDTDRWNRTPAAAVLVACAFGAAAWVLINRHEETNVRFQVPFFLALLFACCWYLHGRLALRKPPASDLTRFYLMVSFGGAIGGISVGILAPLSFPGYFELPWALALSAMGVMFLEYRKHWITDIVWASAAISQVLVAAMFVILLKADSRVMVRNFYGGIRIVDSKPDVSPPTRSMVHGAITHGVQLREPGKNRTTTAYYAVGSGVHQAIEQFRSGALRVGVVGLGAGTLAAYGRPGDLFRFYEINPQVADLARQEFTFLSDTPARVEIVIADGRLALEREPPGRFDVLAVDAFSGDSIPVHLLSREAFEVYFRHLRPGGAVAVHISNQALDLTPVVAAIAQSHDKAVLRMVAQPDHSLARSESHWMLVAERAEFDRRPGLRANASSLEPKPGFPLWTDDYSNLLQVLR